MARGRFIAKCGNMFSVSYANKVGHVIRDQLKFSENMPRLICV